MQPSARGDAARVNLWIARPAAITDRELLMRYTAVLSRDEDDRMGRLQVSIAKRFLVTRALVRWALSQAADVAPAAWRFAANDYGKPHIAGPKVSPPLFFNLSHSGDLVVCAVTSHGPVGADVEFLGHGRRFTDVADRFFAPSEASSVRARKGAEQRVEFYRNWTLQLRGKKRTVAWLTPRSKHFLVSMAYGEKAAAAARASDLPDETKTLIETAEKYAEGRAVRLEIRFRKDAEIARKVAAVRMAI